LIFCAYEKGLSQSYELGAGEVLFIYVLYHGVIPHGYSHFTTSWE